MLNGNIKALGSVTPLLYSRTCSMNTSLCTLMYKYFVITYMYCYTLLVLWPYCY